MIEALTGWLGVFVLGLVGMLAGWGMVLRRDRRLAREAEAAAHAKAIVQAAREAERVRALQAGIARPDRDELHDKLGKGRF